MKREADDTIIFLQGQRVLQFYISKKTWRAMTTIKISQLLVYNNYILNNCSVQKTSGNRIQVSLCRNMISQ